MRDVTWRPTRQPKALSRRRGRFRLLVILLAVNIGVVVYHGDPRDQFAEPAEAPQGSEPVATPTPSPIASEVDDAKEIGKGSQPNLGLEPGDIVSVPEALF